MTKPTNKTNETDAKLEEAKRMEAQKAAYDHYRGALLDRAAEYGEKAAIGQTSLTALAFYFNEAVRRGMATEGDARLVYGAYAEKFNAAVAAQSVTIGNVAYATTTDKLIDLDEKSIKTPVSMFRTFGRPAVVAQGLELYTRVQAACGLLERSKRIGSVYNCMVAVNRGVTEASEASLLSDAQVAAGEFAVTDEMIAAWIAAPEKAQPKERDFATRLAALVTDCAKLVKKGECPNLKAVYDLLVDVEKAHKAAKDAAPLSTLVTMPRIDAGTPTIQ